MLALITVKTILGKTGINVSVIYPWIKSEFFYTPISFSGFSHDLSMIYPCFTQNGFYGVITSYYLLPSKLTFVVTFGRYILRSKVSFET